MRAAHQKKKQLRKPKAIPSQESTLRKHQQKIQERATKKKKRDDEDDDDEEDSGSDDEESADELLLTKETEGEKTQFNFEFSDMKEEFYGGIQLMLAKQLYSTGAAHDITEIIIKQDELGTVVHCEGETDVFAYASILPATKLAVSRTDYYPALLHMLYVTNWNSIRFVVGGIHATTGQLH